MRCVRILLVSACLLAVVSRANAWETCESYTPMPGHHHAPFELGCWGVDDSHLHALFTYPWRRYPDDPAPVPLHGKKDGQFFRPNVTFQIGRCWAGPWKTIGRSHAGDDLLKIDKAKGGGALEVQLDIFRPHLRSGKCGRVVLESGEGAAFRLNIFLLEKNSEKSAK